MGSSLQIASSPELYGLISFFNRGSEGLIHDVLPGLDAFEPWILKFPTPSPHMRLTQPPAPPGAWRMRFHVSSFPLIPNSHDDRVASSAMFAHSSQLVVRAICGTFDPLARPWTRDLASARPINRVAPVASPEMYAEAPLKVTFL